MSDLLLGQPLFMVLPVVAVIALVCGVYAFAVKPSPTPSLSILEDTSSKKAKLTKKKQKSVKKDKVSNGHVAITSESAKPVSNVPSSSTKSLKPPKDNAKPQEVKTTKKKQTAEEKKSEKAAAEKNAALRNEKAAMKREATQGDWVTVGSKDKKVKARSTTEPQVNDKAVDGSKSEEEAASTTQQTPSNKKALTKKDAPKGGKTVSKASVATSDKKKITENGSVTNAELSKLKPNTVKPSKDANGAVSKEKIITPPVVEQVKSKKESVEKDSVVEPVIAKAKVETNATTPVPEATDAAFDEMGDWEQAKPLKMKKRARRER